MPLNLSEEEIEKPFQYSLRCEDASIIADLRYQPQGDKEGRFNYFLRKPKNIYQRLLALHVMKEGMVNSYTLLKLLALMICIKGYGNVYQKGLPPPLLNGCVINSNR